MVLGGFLEWDQTGMGLVESLLRPRGAGVRLVPLTPKTKTRWFISPTPMAPGLVERGRFLVEARRQGPVELAFPPREPEVFVPLARLHGPRARRAEVRATLDERTSGAWDRRPSATVLTPDDVAALEHLLDDCARGVLDLDTPVPFAIHDACRFGARPCLKAHGAIVDTHGGVRPCTHAPPVGTVEDTSAAYHDRMVALRTDLEERRGCARCPAEPVCSKCAFPHVLDEPAYCDLVRRHAAALPTLHRVLGVLTDQQADSVRAGHLRLRFGVAEGGDDTAPLPELRRRLRAAVLTVRDGESAVSVPGSDETFPLTPTTVPIIERVMTGAAPAEPSPEVDALLYFLTQWLSP